MVDTRKIGLILIQIVVGCAAGLILGGISLFAADRFWDSIKEAHIRDLLTALLLLTTFFLVLGIGIIATSEGVKAVGRGRQKKEAPRKWIYEGSFLGLCSAVALLTVTRSDWLGTLQEWGGFVQFLGTAIYYLLVKPVWLFTFWIPPLFLLAIAAPVGAVIAYYFPPKEVATSSQESA